MTDITTNDDDPFSLKNHTRYARWRDKKLNDYPYSVESLRVSIENPFQPTSLESKQLTAACRRTNMAIFTTTKPEKNKLALKILATSVGLTIPERNLCADQDAISAIEVSQQGNKAEYVPYSNRPLSWHTDGYYNPPHQLIRAMILYCVQDAAVGGDNGFIDHEMVYIQLREQNPEFITALADPDVLTIPANQTGGKALRPAQSGPVFSIDPKTSTLHMRYTARTRSIVWKRSPIIDAARNFLNTLLTQENPYRLDYRLQAGEGIICNNILHNRSGFKDYAEGTHRLVYRGRYQNRIIDT